MEQNTKMRSIFSILLLACCQLYSFSQKSSGVYDFLEMPVSSRVNALGGENVSIIERDVSLLFHNPSLMGPEMDMDMHFGFVSYLGGINAGSAAFSKALGERSAWGIGANYVNYGSIQETTIDNELLGEVSAKDMSFNAFFSRDLSDDWRGGVTTKMIYSSFGEYNSIGLAVDLGLSYYNRERDFSFGLAAKNVGRQVKSYNDIREKLPWDIQLGISQKLSHAPLRISVTALHLTQWKFKPLTEGSTEKDSFFETFFKHFVFGADILLSDNFWLGIGYNPKLGSDMKLQEGNKLGGFSGGGGIRVKAFDVGFSVSRFHPSATSFQINVVMALSELKL